MGTPSKGGAASKASTKTASKGASKSGSTKKQTPVATKSGVSGQGLVEATASNFEKPTRSMLVAGGKGKNMAGHAIKPKGKQVPQPVSTPENTNQGAAPYDAPKEDYGGDLVSKPFGTYMGDVVATAANTDLPDAP